MRAMYVLCAFGLSVPSAVFAQVTVNGLVPISGATSFANVRVAAAASSTAGAITGWSVYFNNSEVFTNTKGLNGRLDTVVSSVGPGNYKVTVIAYDQNGNQASYVANNVVVASATLPTVPASAEVYQLLQTATPTAAPYNVANGAIQSWAYCVNTTCSGSQTQGSGNVLFFTSTPTSNPLSSYTLSGTSLQETSTGATNNTLAYRKLGCTNNGGNTACNNVQNMLLDVWFYPTTTSDVQQFEFDPDVFYNNYKFAASVACRLAGTNPDYWYLWDSSANNWVQTQYPCSATSTTAGQSVAANTWHHLQLYVNYSVGSIGGSYAYQTFVWDGKTVFQNSGQSFTAIGQAGNTINVEQQIDNTSTSGANNTAYYDDYSLSVW